MSPQNTYQIRKVSESEYHVIEWSHGSSNNPEEWFVIAKCSGPVPANDVLKALALYCNFLYSKGKLVEAANLDVNASARATLAAIESYHCVPTPTTQHNKGDEK